MLLVDYLEESYVQTEIGPVTGDARSAHPQDAGSRADARLGITQRIQQISDGVLQVNQGSLYPALLRLDQQGWITSEWGVSENNRQAKYYRLTRSGRKQLAEETENWKRLSAAIEQILQAT
jgi:PadR family transcriptional regulator, regulatory protein PadR